MEGGGGGDVSRCLPCLGSRVSATSSPPLPPLPTPIPQLGSHYHCPEPGQQQEESTFIYKYRDPAHGPCPDEAWAIYPAADSDKHIRVSDAEPEQNWRLQGCLWLYHPEFARSPPRSKR